MDFGCCAQSRFDSPLYPGVRERGVLSGKMNAAFGGLDGLIEQRLLARRKERERAPRELVIVPYLGSADLELVLDLRMNLRHVVQRLRDAILLVQRTPALRVLRPGIAFGRRWTTWRRFIRR